MHRIGNVAFEHDALPAEVRSARQVSPNAERRWRVPVTALNDDPDRRARTRRRAALARDEDARRAIYNNRAWLLSGSPERRWCCVRCRASGPSHVLDRGGLRRTRLGGRDAVAKRYLVQVAAYTLGLLMRALLGAGSPRAAADLRPLSLAAGDRLLLVVVAASLAGSAALAIATITPDDPRLSSGC